METIGNVTTRGTQSRYVLFPTLVFVFFFFLNDFCVFLFSGFFFLSFLSLSFPVFLSYSLLSLSLCSRLFSLLFCQKVSSMVSSYVHCSKLKANKEKSKKRFKSNGDVIRAELYSSQKARFPVEPSPFGTDFFLLPLPLIIPKHSKIV